MTIAEWKALTPGTLLGPVENNKFFSLDYPINVPILEVLEDVSNPGWDTGLKCWKVKFLQTTNGHQKLSIIDIRNKVWIEYLQVLSLPTPEIMKSRIASIE